MKDELDARGRILEAAMAMLEETGDAEGVTVRQIAERAGVGVGLVNYHFHTKDNLMNTAVGEQMAQMATSLLEFEGVADPVEKLKHMLKALCDFGALHEKHIRIGITYELQHGNFQVPMFLLPVLREIFGTEKDDVSLRMIALQIIITTQLALLRKDAFFMYTGISITDKTQRDGLLDKIIANFL